MVMSLTLLGREDVEGIYSDQPLVKGVAHDDRVDVDCGKHHEDEVNLGCSSLWNVNSLSVHTMSGVRHCFYDKASQYL